jgi:glycosyltransferase involved in cell wall biosynthesis
VIPVISVVIPSYNRRHVLRRAVQSVLDQQMEQFELIVVDDGSDDGTGELVEAFDDPRLVLVVQENAGVCAARNAGVAVSSCEFVTFLDSDDEAGPEWLRFYADAIRDGYQLASCGVHFVGPGSLYKLVLPERSGPAFGNIHARFLAGTFAVDTELLRSVGGFRSGLKFSENTELGLRLGGRMLSQPFRTTSTSEPLLTFHRDERPHDPALQYESSMTILREDLIHLRRSRSMHSTYTAIAGVAASKLGRHAEARRLLAQAVRINPLGLKNYLRLGREVAFGR